MSDINVAILGASGFTGSELLRLLLNHPNVNVSHVTAEKHAGKLVSDVFPHLKGKFDLELKPLKSSLISSDIDFVFVALPHGTSSEFVKELYDRDIKIVDLGADFRISQGNYEKWYGDHGCPELIDEAVYGISELNKDKILDAKLVANPGCYPMSAILALSPLLQDKLIDETSIIIDSKSGVSGAGRSPSLELHFCEVDEGVKAYKIGVHRHTPEIEEVLSSFSGLNVKVGFTPHLIPMDRGILSTIYVNLNSTQSTAELLDLFEDFYKDSYFVRIYQEGQFPSTSNVRGSNYCDIGLRSFPETNTAVVVSVIDNLVKGASGQAVQNMNIMMDYPEISGLDLVPIFP